ncbi:hypothetical protein QBC39DRAFT_360095 [Podospora conica]|nr:hypothetical protein QBC39DRAFT_360095 [Schizothecium conicum]
MLKPEGGVDQTGMVRRLVQGGAPVLDYRRPQAALVASPERRILGNEGGDAGSRTLDTSRGNVANVLGLAQGGMGPEEGERRCLGADPDPGREEAIPLCHGVKEVVLLAQGIVVGAGEMGQRLVDVPDDVPDKDAGVEGQREAGERLRQGRVVAGLARVVGRELEVGRRQSRRSQDSGFGIGAGTHLVGPRQARAQRIQGNVDVAGRRGG